MNKYRQKKYNNKYEIMIYQLIKNSFKMLNMIIFKYTINIKLINLKLY